MINADLRPDPAPQVRPARIIGHRGAAGLAPENTIVGFQTAKDVGASWIECDVALLADGTPIMFHDKELEKKSTGTGLVSEKDYDYIQTLDVGSWFSPEFEGERVPKLDEALAALSQLKLCVNLEMKVNGDEGDALAAAVDQYLNFSDEPAHGRRPGELVVSSFRHSALDHLRSLDPDVPIALLYWQIEPDWFETVTRLNAVAVSAVDRHITRHQIDDLHSRDVPVGIFTVNDPARAQELFDWGVSFIFTDVPHLFDKSLLAKPA